MMPTVARGARIDGSTTLTSVPRRPAPSMRAASSISTGIVLKNWRSRKMPNGVTRLGAISAGSVSTRPRPRTISSVGTITTWNGTISVARITRNRAPLPKKRMRARA